MFFMRRFLTNEKVHERSRHKSRISVPGRCTRDRNPPMQCLHKLEWPGEMSDSRQFAKAVSGMCFPRLSARSARYKKVRISSLHGVISRCKKPSIGLIVGKTFKHRSIIPLACETKCRKCYQKLHFRYQKCGF